MNENVDGPQPPRTATTATIGAVRRSLQPRLARVRVFTARCSGRGRESGAEEHHERRESEPDERGEEDVPPEQVGKERPHGHRASRQPAAGTGDRCRKDGMLPPPRPGGEPGRGKVHDDQSHHPGKVEPKERIGVDPQGDAGGDRPRCNAEDVEQARDGSPQQGPCPRTGERLTPAAELLPGEIMRAQAAQVAGEVGEVPVGVVRIQRPADGSCQPLRRRPMTRTR